MSAKLTEAQKSERIKKMQQLHDKGLTYKNIAKELRISNIALMKFRSRLNQKFVKSGYIDDPNKNKIAVSADGELVFLGLNDKFVEVRSYKLRQAIKEIYGFKDWQIL